MTLVLVIVTSIISVFCFSNHEWSEKLRFNPYKVYHKKEYYRLITHGFIHADWMHLIINMLVLFSFGSALELYFTELKNTEILKYNPSIYYIILYLSALVISSLTTLKKYKDDYNYNAVGASGAVSTVLFACIFFNPWQKLLFWAIIPVPGILFGVLYLWYSQYMSKRSNDNINHDAHFLGALYGLTFPVLLEPRLFYVFFNQLIHFKI